MYGFNGAERQIAYAHHLDSLRAQLDAVATGQNARRARDTVEELRSQGFNLIQALSTTIGVFSE